MLRLIARGLLGTWRGVRISNGIRASAVATKLRLPDRSFAASLTKASTFATARTTMLPKLPSLLVCARRSFATVVPRVHSDLRAITLPRIPSETEDKELCEQNLRELERLYLIHYESAYDDFVMEILRSVWTSIKAFRVSTKLHQRNETKTTEKLYLVQFSLMLGRSCDRRFVPNCQSNWDEMARSIRLNGAETRLYSLQRPGATKASPFTLNVTTLGDGVSWDDPNRARYRSWDSNKEDRSCTMTFHINDRD